MRSLPILAVGLCCSALAACGGVSGNQADWYDPSTVSSAGPIPVSVVGTAQPGVLEAVTAAMRAKGIQPAAVSGSPAAMSLTVLVGSPATRAVALDGGWGYTMCKTINHNPGALERPAGSGSTEATPVLAVLCSGDNFMSLGWEGNLGGNGDLHSEMSAIVGQVFPAINFQHYTMHNLG